MNAATVEFLFRDDERAGGTVRIPEGIELPWTAVHSDNDQWYVVLHGEFDCRKTSQLRLILDTIKNSLQPPQTAVKAA